ncbi:hypothetical protein [Reyranella sp.]|jgi:hypothetical protein|uniref:hypothetical protein n=1 Tax=Reyranella sp. TaxID=1929291 RepID=UPI002F9410F2
MAKSDSIPWIACDVSSGAAVENLIATTRRKTIDGYLTSVFLCMRHEIRLVLKTGAAGS